MKHLTHLVLCFTLFTGGRSYGQPRADWQLEKMPANLERDFARSALPPQLRQQATIYLLDPKRGYYIDRQGSNGFICFVSRTEWEWGEFRDDLAVPMSYDAEGAKTIFLAYYATAAMRASGQFTALQIQDSVAKRIRKKIYKAPARAGISYMLSPLMRAYAGDPDDKTIHTVSVPHCMLYAPYVTDTDLGITPTSRQNFILGNPGDYVLGKGKGPFGILIFPVDGAQKVKILDEQKDLLKRLAAYKPYFKTESGKGHH